MCKVKLCFCMSAMLISFFAHSAYCMQMSIFEAASKGCTFQIKRGVFSGEIHKQDAKERTPLFHAVRDGQEKAVERLIVGKADLHKTDKSGMFPLEVAAIKGFDIIAGKLLSAGARLDQRDKRGWTALFAAVAQGHKDVVATFIAASSDVNQAVNYGLFPRDGMYPLEAAAIQGRQDIVQLLLDAGADVDKVDALGWTALLWAVFNAHQAVALQLLKAGANPCHQERHFGFTPLYWAVSHGQLPVVEELMKRGADPKVVNKEKDVDLFQKAQDMGRMDILIALSGNIQEALVLDQESIALAKRDLLTSLQSISSNIQEVPVLDQESIVPESRDLLALLQSIQ